MNKAVRSRSLLNALKESFQVLKNRIFSLLYFAESISLLGDAFTWVGLALLSYQFGKERSAVILATALTLRVTAFIIFSPFAGVLADRMSRKIILYVTHFIRMAIVACLPFVDQEWQIYVLVFLLNIFNAFFTPTYRAVIPQVVDHANYRQAVGLSTATFQILGVLGPGLAGILAVWFGARDIFFIDAVSFVIAAILILMLPAAKLQHAIKKNEKAFTAWHDAIKGIRLLFKNPLIRFALLIEFVSAIAGAQILVNTVGHIKSGLHLDDKHYGWVMAAFGIGASIAAFVAGSLDKTKSRRLSLIIGATVLAITISITNFVGYPLMLVLWLFAGLGQSLTEMPSETLIGENIAENEQGKVYGSHFAFSHLWWAVAYPIAGFMGSHYPGKDFLYGGVVSFFLLGIALLFTKRAKKIISL
ncbi:MFS transporter [Mucilaginibacter gilvus]|uniref:MFS transporter n=1 Tax=Mucilaginibacter gilvus TaxID=2305909 RepID=A0A444MJE4_9SPHI|nr:MFS transporter [Mucilaginibacter gilvus]RWY48345.1 MFS transporter [Mucilaginibacter gilvus]